MTYNGNEIDLNDDTKQIKTFPATVKLDGSSFKIKEYGNVEVYKSILPDEYEEVEYLKSTGTQYIDTKYYFNGGSAELNIKFSMLEISPNIWCWYGVSGTRAINNYNSSFLLGIVNNGNDTYLRASSGNVLLDNGIIVDDTPTVNEIEEIKLIIDEDNKTLTLINKDKSSSMVYGAQAMGSKSVALFGVEEWYGISSLSSSIIYNASIIDNDVLVRNFIPCYRKSDNKPGLYDTVNNQFYINQGSGEDFILGPEV